MRFITLLLLSIAPAFALCVHAQEPPGRVGRLAYVEGPVTIFQDPEQGWEQAYVNAPITAENSVWTDPGARAEVHVAGIAIRLDEATQLDVAKLDDDGLSAFMPRGSAGVRVRHIESNELLEISTPNARFSLYGMGRYRIDVDPDRDETLLTVFEGSASMRSSGGDVKIDAARAVRVYGGPSPSFTFERAATNAFDRWSQARDERWVEATSTRYVSPSMTGYEDLDPYGSWAEEPDYGAIWYPTRVAADWAPYREGHWAWVRPWGWTWIDDAPWGFAPFHYGRWVRVRDRWAWYPGRRQDHPAWSPALVAWIGGANFNVRIGAGSAPAIGWYPLAPWDRYEPWYRANQNYVNRVNAGVRERPPRQWEGQGRGDFRAWNREQGSTVIRRDQFVDRRPVGQARINVAPEVIRQAPAAVATTLLPSRNEFQRGRTQNRGNIAPAQGTNAPQPAQQGSRGNDRGDRSNPVARPQFARPQVAPAPAPAPNNQPPAQARQQPVQPVAPSPQANPLQRVRPASPQQQAQPPQQVPPPQQVAPPQQAQPPQQVVPAQQAQPPRQLQPQQPDAQRARDAQTQEERLRAQAAQRQQQEALQRQQQDAKQREERDRATREANRQQQLQQLQQSRQERERAAREAQQPQPAKPQPVQPQPVQPQPVRPQPAQPQPAAAQPPQKTAPRPERDDKDKDSKDNKDSDQGGRGRQR
ncbi:MAG: DUF6600 domain-containing protein [Usitatibacter sp.]